MSHTAELIAVGTEILLGNIANTDAQMLSEELAALGVNVLYHTVVGDNPTRLAETLELARRRVDICHYHGRFWLRPTTTSPSRPSAPCSDAKTSFTPKTRRRSAHTLRLHWTRADGE